jgi:hypothetical protein
MSFKKFLFVVLIALAFLPVKGQDTDHVRMELQYLRDTLRVSATYRLLVGSETDSLFFVLNPGYPLQAVKAEGLRSHEIGNRPDRPFPGYVLKFGKPFEAGTRQEVRFDYLIDLRTTNHLNSDWVELNVDKLWFPIHGDLGSLITYEVDIIGFPEDFDLMSHMNARLERSGGRILIKQPNPVQEVLILAGRDMQMRQLSDSISFFAGKKHPDSLLHSMHVKVRNTIDFLNGTVGGSDPVSQFKVVLRNTPRSELGYQYNRRNMIVTGPDFDDYGNLSHEIAHYWWSGADFISEPWMNESFANYLMFLVLEHFDPEAYRSLTGMYREIASKAPPVATATLFSEGAQQAYYHKGGILLLDLESEIGKQKMFRLLNYMVSEDIHDTEGFLKALQYMTTAEVRKGFEATLNE